MQKKPRLLLHSDESDAAKRAKLLASWHTIVMITPEATATGQFLSKRQSVDDQIAVLGNVLSVKATQTLASRLNAISAIVSWLNHKGRSSMSNEEAGCEPTGGPVTGMSVNAGCEPQGGPASGKLNVQRRDYLWPPCEESVYEYLSVMANESQPLSRASSCMEALKFFVYTFGAEKVYKNVVVSPILAGMANQRRAQMGMGKWDLTM